MFYWEIAVTNIFGIFFFCSNTKTQWKRHFAQQTVPSTSTFIYLVLELHSHSLKRSKPSEPSESVLHNSGVFFCARRKRVRAAVLQSSDIWFTWSLPELLFLTASNMTWSLAALPGQILLPTGDCQPSTTALQGLFKVFFHVRQFRESSSSRWSLKLKSASEKSPRSI